MINRRVRTFRRGDYLPDGAEDVAVAGMAFLHGDRASVDVPISSHFRARPCEPAQDSRRRPVAAPPRRAGGGVTFRAGGHVSCAFATALDEPRGTR
jgi:hypothetical protein